MDSVVVREIFVKRTVSVSDLIKHTHKSEYTVYATVNKLKELGVIRKQNGLIELQKNSLRTALEKLVIEGFSTEFFKGKGLNVLMTLLEWKNAEELAQELKMSSAQIYRYLKEFSALLSQNESRYRINERIVELHDFLIETKKSESENIVWKTGEEKLLKLPKEIEFKGTLTAFSAFSENRVQIMPTHNFVFQPEKELSLEEILVHAIRFSKNAHELMLCIFFYLKNKKTMNIIKIEKLAEKFGVIEQWFDINRYLMKEKVDRKEWFFPFNEFEEKAKMYNLKITKTHELRKIEEMFNDIERFAEKELKLYLIGGSALLQRELKIATKDIDIVVENKEQFTELKRILKAMGLKEILNPSKQYAELHASIIMEKPGVPRIDIFTKKICNTLELSKEMTERAEKWKENKVKVFLLSVEDIFLLKTVSSRDSDILDSVNILSKKKLNWNVIWQELEKQQKNLESLQELTILDHLEVMENKTKTRIPITKKVLQLTLEKTLLFLLEKPCTVKELREKVRFSETKIRNELRKQVKEGKIRKIEEKPIKFVKV